MRNILFFLIGVRDPSRLLLLNPPKQWQRIHVVTRKASCPLVISVVSVCIESGNGGAAVPPLSGMQHHAATLPLCFCFLHFSPLKQGAEGFASVPPLKSLSHTESFLQTRNSPPLLTGYLLRWLISFQTVPPMEGDPE